MSSPILFCVVGCGLALLGMLLGFGLVRLAANLLVALVALGALGAVVYFIFTGAWISWAEVVLYSLGLGFGAALVSLPALPFSTFFRRK